MHNDDDYLRVLYQCLQTEGLHLLRRNRGKALGIRQPIATKTPQTTLNNEAHVLMTGYRN